MMPRSSCRPPSTLQFGSLPKLLASLPPQPFDRDLTIDMHELRWIEALPIAVLVAYVKRHVRTNPTTKNEIRIPRRHEYLQRMDFFRALGGRLPETFKRRDPTGRFVPVCEIQAGADVARAAEDIVRTLQIADPDAARTLRHCVGEIVDNVFVHARSCVNAVICAQHFPNARRSQVGIVDTGVGFLESFRESPAFAQYELTERLALGLGLAPFVTSKPPTGAPYEQGYGRLGVGLFIVSEVLSLIGGRMLVVTGSTAVDRRGGTQRWFNVNPWKGAIVGFEVPDDPLVSYEDATRAARARAQQLRCERGTSV